MITKHLWIRPLAIAWILALAPRAWGQAPPTATVAPMSAEATSHFEMGTRHYNLQEWAEAVKEYKEAYRLAPRPDILWSIAQAQRLGGDHEAAIKSYQAFLRAGPSEKQAALANEAILKCQAALLEKAAAPAPSTEPAKNPEPKAPTAGPSVTATSTASASTGPTPPRGPEPFYTDVLGDVLTLGGVAGVVFGGVALGIGGAKTADTNAATDYASFDRLRGEGPMLQTAGVIGLAAGGALLATGVVRLLLVARRPAAPAPEAARASAGVTAGPGSILVNVSGRF